MDDYDQQKNIGQKPDKYENIAKNTIVAGIIGGTLATSVIMNEALEAIHINRENYKEQHEKEQIKNNQCTETGNLFCHIKLKGLDEKTLRNGKELQEILGKDRYSIILQKTNQAIVIDLSNISSVNQGADIILADRKKQNQINSRLP